MGCVIVSYALSARYFSSMFSIAGNCIRNIVLVPISLMTVMIQSTYIEFKRTWYKKSVSFSPFFVP